jgi:hypothetical protein
MDTGDYILRDVVLPELPYESAKWVTVLFLRGVLRLVVLERKSEKCRWISLHRDGEFEKRYE